VEKQRPVTDGRCDEVMRGMMLRCRGLWKMMWCRGLWMMVVREMG
jgi:hypothetical protein